MSRVARRLCLVLILAKLLETAPDDGACPTNGTASDESRESRRSAEPRRATLSRRKRYLTFPKGSAFTLTPSMLKALQIEEPKGWNLALELDVIWPIPSQEDLRKLDRDLLRYRRRRPPLRRHRRHKRDLYANLEAALDSYDLPGKQCILRTMCEARTLLNSPGVSIVDDMLRVILSNFARSAVERDEYDVAYSTGKDCDSTYPCPFSALAFLPNYGTS